MAWTTVEAAPLVYVRLIGVSLDRHCGGGHDLSSASFVGVGTQSYYVGWHYSLGCWSGLCSIGRRRPSNPLWWPARQVTGLLWPLVAWSAWAHAAIVVAGTTFEGAALASVPSDGICSASQPQCRQTKCLVGPTPTKQTVAGQRPHLSYPPP